MTTTRQSVRRMTAFAFAAATVLGTIETVKGYVAGRSAPNEFGWTEAALANMPWWLLWAVLAPLVFAISRRWPLLAPRRTKSIAFHILASILLPLVHLGVAALIIWIAVSQSFQTLSDTIRELMVGYFISDVVTYWAIVAACTTYWSGQRLRAAERESHELQLRTARLESEAVQLRAGMTQARLDALRMELNPHFLFNTLNTVSALARRGEGDDAVQVIARLSDLLRHTLASDGDHEVTLDEEMSTLEKYLAIERLRFGDRLTVGVTVDPAVRRALIPAFILQPLVENAVHHGVASVRGPVRIDIEARGRNESLEITVSDSGNGFVDPDSVSAGGIGLRNTRSRLEALYGDSAQLAIGAQPGSGGIVRMVMPLRIEDGVRVDA